MTLNDPLPGESKAKAIATPAEIEDDGAAFMAAMQKMQMGGL
jgi:hypothetical protein